MNQLTARMDPYAIRMNTSFARTHLQDAIAQALAAKDDVDRMARIKKCLCKFCYYFRQSRIGGAAMTERPCGICKKPVMYGSTATDVLCLDCAKEHSICKQCGADRELRPHRRKFPKLPLEEKVEANRRAAIAKRATTVTLLPMAKPNGSSVILKSGALVQPKMHGVKGFVTATGVMLPKRITNPADKFTDCGRPAGSPYEGQD